MGTADKTRAPGDSSAMTARVVFVGVLVIGWVFILRSNKFHITAPTVFVCLGYLAVISTVYNLWRTGAATVAPDEAVDGTWGRPIGARGELEKEKKTLLKAIKEAEFDFAMGKLSKADAEELILSYRARAIEVIKELDRVEAGAALSTRDQIAREVKARIELAASDKPSKRAKNAVAAQADRAEAKAERAAAKAAKASASESESESDSASASDSESDAAVAAAKATTTEPAKAEAT